MKPITALEALQVLFDALDGKDISLAELNRAKEIVRNKIMEE